jgi:hypothetical protein
MRFPGVATFNIDGPGNPADVKAISSDNVEDGTLHRTRPHPLWLFECSETGVGGWEFKIQNSEFKIQNSQRSLSSA